MTYRTALTQAMTDLAADPLTCFVGYGLAHSRAMGTMTAAKPEQIIETPVAENLMTGAAIGLSLAGRKPVVYFERADFLLCAADALVNHLNAMAELSRGAFTPAVVIRVTVGNRSKPLFTGPVHTQDLSDAFALMVNFPVFRLTKADQIQDAYQSAKFAQDRGESSMLFEYKDML